MSDSKSSALGMEPFRVGEHPTLDFANTLVAPFGEPIDFIALPEMFLRWARDTVGMEQTYRLAMEAHKRGELQEALHEVRMLRNWLRGLLPRVHSNEAATDTDVAIVLNRVLAAAENHWCLMQQSGQSVFVLESRYASPASVAAELAVLIGQLLTQVNGADVRRCENPSCALWFRDTTKRGNRRWCSMAVCGNRAKAAAHRQRSKSDI
jgi:predicted RNA-binding Zn ribbon-like protein